MCLVYLSKQYYVKLIPLLDKLIYIDYYKISSQTDFFFGLKALRHIHLPAKGVQGLQASG